MPVKSNPESTEPDSVQVKFRCPRELYDRIESTKILRNQTTQQLCADALRRHIETDPAAQRLTHQEWMAQYKSTSAQIAAEIGQSFERPFQILAEAMKDPKVLEELDKGLASANIYLVAPAKSEVERTSIEFFRLFLTTVSSSSYTTFLGLMKDLILLTRAARSGYTVAKSEDVPNAQWTSAMRELLSEQPFLKAVEERTNAEKTHR